MLGIILCACATLLLAIYTYFRHAHTYWQRRQVPTLGTTSFPFGDVRRLIFRQESVNETACRLYRRMRSEGHDYAGLYFFSRKVLVVLAPKLVQAVLARDFQHFHDRGIHYDEENDPISAHLFSLHGQKWKTLRTKLTPAFTSGKVKYMFAAIQTCADEMVSLIDRELRMSSTTAIEIKDVMARFATDVIGSCAFGLECNSLKQPDAQFRRMGQRAFTQTRVDALKMVLIRSFPWLAKRLGLGIFARSVSTFFRNVVEETFAYRLENGVVRADFLQLLIQLTQTGQLNENAKKSSTADEMLTLNEAAAQAFIFFLAGFETTSTTISFTLLELARNKPMQVRARDELMLVLSQVNDDVKGSAITYDVLVELVYLDMVIQESLRIYPPAPVYLRKCTEDYQIPGTKTIIEKGLSVLVPAMALHKDPEYFPDPEKFDPERFSKENKQRIKDFTYIPFGDGPRICIGMRFALVQIKLAIALLLMNYKFKLSERMNLPLVMEKKGIVLTPIGGIWIEFEKLNDNQ